MIPILIHGFSPVNARLLTVYGTAFYAIICDVTLLSDVNCLLCDLSNLFNDVLTVSFDV